MIKSDRLGQLFGRPRDTEKGVFQMIKDITTRRCWKMYIYDSRYNPGCKEAYLHFVDGMEIWRYTPEWGAWKLMSTVVGEKEVC